MAFWELSKSGREHKLAEAKYEADVIHCPLDDGHQREGKRTSDLNVFLPGKSVDSIVWTWLSYCLIQDHVLESFRSHGLTGFDVRPCTARFKKATDTPPPRLWELVVTGWAGIAPGSRIIEHCEGCGHTVYSFSNDPDQFIQTDQWDGSDFFIVWPLPKFIFVSERVAELIRQEKWRDAELIPLKDVFDPTDDNKAGPGRLSYYMPEERAKQLGEPLGIY
jgi:hypothetical protein